MARRPGGSHVAPSTRTAPPHEYLEEDIFDWVRRQNNPVKLVKPKATRPPGAIEAALMRAAGIDPTEKDDPASAATERDQNQTPSEGSR